MINYDLIADVALRQIQNPIAKVILIALASYSNAQGQCFPSQQRLAEDAAVSLRTVIISIQWLESNGYIRILKRPNKSNIYTLTCMEEEEVTEKKENGSAEYAHEVVSNITKLDIDKKISKKEDSYSTLTSSAKSASPKDNPFFLAFWESYPRRIGKGAARTAFAKSVKLADPNDIIQASIKYADHCQESGTEKQFIPHPSTWLNAERWEDDIESEKIEVKKVAGWLNDL